MCSSRRASEHGWLYRLIRARLRWLLHVYEAGLRLVLRHRFITLMVMSPPSPTRYLYVVIPKGFFPAAGHRTDPRPVRGGAGHFLRSMQERQQSLPMPSCATPPSTAWVGGRRRRRHLPLNDGRVFIRLGPRTGATRSTRSCGGCSTALAEDPAASRFICSRSRTFSIGDAAEQDAVSIHLERRRPRRAQPLGEQVPRDVAEAP